MINVRIKPKIKINAGLSMINLKLIEAPTPMKNKPKSNPLNGAISPSNSCLNSEFAKTTPAIKAPKAGLKPTNCIK